MGEVWQAAHLTLREQVAIKLLTAPFDGIPIEAPEVASARFRFEAQVAARLSRRTRHIVRVTDHGEEGGLAYLVMELLEGQTLEASLLRRGPMPPADVSDLVGQIARGLAHAHADGIVHRDLKPGNVFLTRDEDDRRMVKLLDFGIARTLRPNRSGAFSTARGVVFGTPGYMSPEQTDASIKLDRQCDLWALATIAYEALSGELPVEGFEAAELLDNVHALRLVPLHDRCGDLPRSLDAFFERAFTADIHQRYESAPDLALAFETAVAGAGKAEVAVPLMPTRLAASGAVANPPADGVEIGQRRKTMRSREVPRRSSTFVRSAVVRSALVLAVAGILSGVVLGARLIGRPARGQTPSTPAESTERTVAPAQTSSNTDVGGSSDGEGRSPFPGLASTASLSDRVVAPTSPTAEALAPKPSAPPANALRAAPSVTVGASSFAASGARAHATAPGGYAAAPASTVGSGVPSAAPRAASKPPAIPRDRSDVL